MTRPLAVALVGALCLLAWPGGDLALPPTAEGSLAGAIHAPIERPALAGRAPQRRADDPLPLGRHRYEVAGTSTAADVPTGLDCDDFAAWVPGTAERVRRAYEIDEEIGRLGAELAPTDFVAAMKGFAVEFAAMADEQWASDPPAGVEEANQELATTFANYAYVAGEIAAMLELSALVLPEGGSIDNSTLADFWALLPRLTDYQDLIVAYLAGLAEGCGIDTRRS